MICRKNIFKLFVQEFNLFLFSEDSQILREKIMKKHRLTKEQFNSLHRIFIEEMNQLPTDI